MGQVTPVRSRIGESTSGAAIEVWTLAALGQDAMGRDADERPAILVVAGLQGQHAVGTRTAESVARLLGEQHADLLATRTVYVIPNMNPDGGGWIGGAGGVRVESGRIPGSGDVDRDGRVDEDGPEDLNGDGIVTQMRVRNPDAKWGLRANLIPNPDEPRLMREAKGEDGEVGQWAVLTEGTDNDGDGRFNEDGAGALTGGLDLSMNFPTHWPEHDDGAGQYALSAPEALALVRWVQEHTNIVAVVVYDPVDTLVSVPATGQYGPEASVPRGIEEGDKAWHTHVSEAFKEVTRISGAGGIVGSGRTAGSFASWAYGDFGVFTFSTPVWVRPDQIKAEAAEGEGEDEPEAAEAADPRAAERERLIAEGYPARVADFLVATPAERQAIMAQVESMSEEDRQAMMMEVMALTPEQQQRVMEAVRGGGGGGPPAGGGAGGHHHDDEEEDAPAVVTGAAQGFEVFRLETIAQPTGGGAVPGTMQPTPLPAAGAPVGQPGGPGGPGGGRRFGGAGGGVPGGGVGGGVAGQRGGVGAGGESGGEDRKWLAYSDESRDGEGFVEWTAFEHPQLGGVEIGGFVPGFRVNPPEEEMERLAAEQTAFLARLLPMLPEVVVEDATVEAVGAGLWRVRVRLSNTGYLPTHSAIGLKARRVMPLLVQISTEPTRVLTGQRFRRFDSIEGSGGLREAEWLVRGERGEQVTIEVRSAAFGTRTQTIQLGEVTP